KDDGLALRGAYITAAVRCAPPDNKPLPSELANCSQYLVSELALLGNVRVVLALGKIGFDAYCRAIGAKGMVFAHGARYDIDDGSKRVWLASYDRGRHRTNAGRLAWQMWIRIFRTARALVEN